MITIKTVLSLETTGAAQPIVEQVRWTLSADTHNLVAGEILGVMSQFVNKYHHANKLLNEKLLYVSTAFKGGAIEEVGYRIEEGEKTYFLHPIEISEGAKFYPSQFFDKMVALDKTIKMEVKPVKTKSRIEQFEQQELEMEFDTTIGAEPKVETKPEVKPEPEVKAEIKAEVKPEPEKEEVKVVEEIKLDEESAAIAKELVERIKAAGIDPTDVAAVAKFVEEETIKMKAEEAAKTETASKSPVHPVLAGALHDEFVAVLKEFGMTQDAHVNGALNGFRLRGAEQAGFVDRVRNVFGDDREVIGIYFRSVMGVDKSSGSFVKTTAYVTADTFRATGNAVEFAITAVAQAINKYGFHMVAKLVEMPFGGRPDAIKNYNYVEDAISKAGDAVWSRVKPKKKEKQAEVKAELEI